MLCKQRNLPVGILLGAALAWGAWFSPHAAAETFMHTVSVIPQPQPSDVVADSYPIVSFGQEVGRGAALTVTGAFNVPTIDPAEYTIVSVTERLSVLVGGAAWNNDGELINASVSVTEDVSWFAQGGVPSNGYHDEASAANSFLSAGQALAHQHIATEIPQATPLPEFTYAAGSEWDQGGYVPLAFKFHSNPVGYTFVTDHRPEGLFAYVAGLQLDVTFELEPTIMPAAEEGLAFAPDGLPPSDPGPAPAFTYLLGGPVPQYIADQLPPEIPVPEPVAALAIPAIAFLRARSRHRSG